MASIGSTLTETNMIKCCFDELPIGTYFYVSMLRGQLYKKIDVNSVKSIQKETLRELSTIIIHSPTMLLTYREVEETFNEVEWM